MTNYDKALELRNAIDFSMRSCWECNYLHRHLITVGGLFTCIDCGRWFMNGGFFDSEEHCNKTFEEREPLKTVTFNITTVGESQLWRDIQERERE